MITDAVVGYVRPPGEIRPRRSSGSFFEKDPLSQA